jgi:hypothetical protein
MSKLFDVYVPLCVKVLVDDQGSTVVVEAAVDWEGAPWSDMNAIDNFYDCHAEEWTGHKRDEKHTLWQSEQQVELVVNDLLYRNLSTAP